MCSNVGRLEVRTSRSAVQRVWKLKHFNFCLISLNPIRRAPLNQIKKIRYNRVSLHIRRQYIRQ